MKNSTQRNKEEKNIIEQLEQSDTPRSEERLTLINEAIEMLNAAMTGATVTAALEDWTAEDVAQATIKIEASHLFACALLHADIRIDEERGFYLATAD